MRAGPFKVGANNFCTGIIFRSLRSQFLVSFLEKNSVSKNLAPRLIEILKPRLVVTYRQTDKVICRGCFILDNDKKRSVRGPIDPQMRIVK